MGEAFLQGGWVYVLCLLCTRWSYSIRSVKVRLMRARPSFLFYVIRPVYALLSDHVFVVVGKPPLENPP